MASNSCVREHLWGPITARPIAHSRAEFAAKCGDSLREIEESAYWLELLEESGILPATKLKDLRTETNELTAIFVTIVMKSKK